MCYHKTKWLNKYNLYKTKFCLTNVDDIPAAFDKEQGLLDFLNFLNIKHPNLYVIDEQIDHAIAFLEVFISGINN